MFFISVKKFTYFSFNQYCDSCELISGQLLWVLRWGAENLMPCLALRNPISGALFPLIVIKWHMTELVRWGKLKRLTYIGSVLLYKRFYWGMILF